MDSYEVLHRAQATVGEGPLWDHGAGVLRWVDTPHGRLHSFDPTTGHVSAVDVGADVGSAILHADGGLVLAQRGRVVHYHPATGQLTTIVEVEADQPTRLLNDAGVDRWQAVGRLRR